MTWTAYYEIYSLSSEPIYEDFLAREQLCVGLTGMGWHLVMVHDLHSKPQTISFIRDLKKEGRTIFLTTHDMQVAEALSLMILP